MSEGLGNEHNYSALLTNGTTAVTGRFEPGTLHLRVQGLIHCATCMAVYCITERFLFNCSKWASLCINSAKTLLVNN